MRIMNKQVRKAADVRSVAEPVDTAVLVARESLRARAYLDTHL
jgi:hypothetical protein